MSEKVYDHEKITYLENGLIARTNWENLIQKKGKRLRKTWGFDSRYKYEYAE